MKVKAFSNEKCSDREPQGNLEVIEILTIVFSLHFWDASYLVILRRRIKMNVHLVNFFSHIKIYSLKLQLFCKLYSCIDNF